MYCLIVERPWNLIIASSTDNSVCFLELCWQVINNRTYFTQLIELWSTPYSQGRIVNKVKIASKLSETISADPWGYWMVVETLIFLPVVIITRENIDSFENMEPQVCSHFFYRSAWPANSHPVPPLHSGLSLESSAGKDHLKKSAQKMSRGFSGTVIVGPTLDVWWDHGRWLTTLVLCVRVNHW